MKVIFTKSFAGIDEINVEQPPPNTNSRKEIDMSMLESRVKLRAAEKVSEVALDEWRAAAAAINKTTRVNWDGVLCDECEFRQNLQEALSHIQKALEALEGFRWPYDEKAW